MTLEIVYRPAGSGADCASILADLPEWFGMPASNENHARAAEAGPAWIALQDGRAVGILTPKDHFDTAVEIYLMAVRPGLHRRGVGRALVGEIAAYAAARGAAYLTVKTQGPSAQYEPYARTRRFYEALGFVAIEELTELWESDPTLIMVRPVSPP